MTKREAINGKPYAGNPHIRFDEGEAASTATSKRGSLLYKITVVSFTMLFFVMCAQAASWSYSSQGFIEIPEITEDSTLTISSGVTVTNTVALTGIGKLTVNGGGTLVLTEDSPNFSGNVYVGKAMVSIRNGGALGTGSVTIQGMF